MRKPEPSDLAFGSVVAIAAAMLAVSVFGAVAGDEGLFLGGVAANCCIAAGCMLFTVITTRR